MNIKQDWETFIRICDKYSEVEYSRIEKKETLYAYGKWVGGVFYKSEIYGVPTSINRLFKASSKNVKVFGNVRIGTYKWTGGGVYKERIICFPRTANSFLEIKPISGEIKELKIDFKYRGEHHYGGVITDDGMVYQPPRDVDHILITDLKKMKSYKMYMPDRREVRYCGTLETPDGLIIFLPEKGRRLLVYERKTESLNYMSDPIDFMPFGPAIGINGKIYAYNADGTGLLQIDVNTYEIRIVQLVEALKGYYGAVCGINGKIYGIPAASDTICEYDIYSNTLRKIFDIENGEAKCAGAGILNDGTICMIPTFGVYAYYLRPDRKIELSDNEIGGRFFNSFY